MKKLLKAFVALVVVSTFTVMLMLRETPGRALQDRVSSEIRDLPSSRKMNHSISSLDRRLHNSIDQNITHLPAEMKPVHPGSVSSHMPGSQRPRLLWVHKHGFGNNLFQYASAYCLAMRSGHAPTITRDSVLLEVFPNITCNTNVTYGMDVHMPVQFGRFPGPKYNERFCCKYDEQTLDWVRSHPEEELLLNGFRESYKYFLPCWDSLKQHLTLHHQLRQTAFGYMARLIKQHFRQKRSRWDFDAFNIAEDQWRDGLPKLYTYIGVHVRRTDKGGMYAPLEFFDRAIRYFVHKHKHPIFLVCSDDIKWCKDELMTRYWFADLVFISEHTTSAHIDFAVLVSCDHSIVTSGTFGWWAAWLAGGEVLFFKSFERALHHFGWQYLQDDYYPPQWRPVL